MHGGTSWDRRQVWMWRCSSYWGTAANEEARECCLTWERAENGSEDSRPSS